MNRILSEAAEKHLSDQAGLVRDSTACWVETWDGTHEGDYCDVCVSYIARHLRNREKNQKKKSEINMCDAGCSTETDRTMRCDACGIPLSVYLLEEGVIEEAEFWLSEDLALPIKPETAYDIWDVFNSWEEVKDNKEGADMVQQLADRINKLVERGL
jgi:hypothetical protein